MRATCLKHVRRDGKATSNIADGVEGQQTIEQPKSSDNLWDATCEVRAERSKVTTLRGPQPQTPGPPVSRCPTRTLTVPCTHTRVTLGLQGPAPRTADLAVVDGVPDGNPDQLDAILACLGSVPAARRRRATCGVYLIGGEWSITTCEGHVKAMIAHA